jgi:Family of unknown function (DUF6634)
MLTDKYPFLLSDYIDDELIAKLRALADDLDRIRGRQAPTNRQYAEAPLITGWRIFIAPSGLRLTGQVSGHPRIRAGLAVTTQLWAADASGRWVRTLSRFYRLGAPAAEIDSDPDHNDSFEGNIRDV